MAYAGGVLAKLALGLALCWAAKHLYALFHPGARVRHELVARDNAAFASSLAGYYFALLVALGGPLTAARGLPAPRLWGEVAAWGLLDALLLNAGSLLKRRLALRRLSLDGEIARGNLSAGIVAAAAHAANGLLLYGALNGERGLAQGLALWAYGQVWLSAAAALLPFFLRCDLPRELASDNRAAAWLSAGALVATGNLMRLALTGEFWGLRDSLLSTSGYAVLGLGAILLLSELVDRALLGGVSLRRELIEQKRPNAGLGFLLAVLWVGASFLAGWCL